MTRRAILALGMSTNLLAVVLLIGLTACSRSSASDVDTTTAEPTQSADESVPAEGSEATADSTSSGYSAGAYSSSDDEEFDEDAAREQAEDELSSEGYDYSYGCIEDCSGHQAGWGYQAQQGYGSYPSGNSRSFEEGRVAFDEAVDERIEEARSEWESEHDE